MQQYFADILFGEGLERSLIRLVNQEAFLAVLKEELEARLQPRIQLHRAQMQAGGASGLETFAFEFPERHSVSSGGDPDPRQRVWNAA